MTLLCCLLLNKLLAYPVNVDVQPLPINHSHSDVGTDSDNESLNEEPRSIDEDDQLLRIRETRDPLLMQKDNHIIFIHADDIPLDKGSKDYQKANKLPQYNDLMVGRARVTEIGNKILIALVVTANKHSSSGREEIINCVTSLTDVIQELQLTSISIAQNRPL